MSHIHYLIFFLITSLPEIHYYLYFWIKKQKIKRPNAKWLLSNRAGTFLGLALVWCQCLYFCAPSFYLLLWCILRGLSGTDLSILSLGLLVIFVLCTSVCGRPRPRFTHTSSILQWNLVSCFFFLYPCSII